MTAPLPTPRELRPYQIEAVDAVLDDWAAGTRRVGVVLPTGAGKSTVIAKLALESYRLGLRVVMLAHRGELLEQMASAVYACDPALPAGTVGIVRAEQDDHHAPIVAATLQTLTTARRRESLGEREVIIWDEVHHIGAEGWHNVLVEMGGYDGAFLAGLTATMRRDDGKLGESIEKVSYEKDLRWAIDQGYLVQPHGLTVKVDDLDLAGVRTVAGDFNQGQLAEVMEACESSVVEAIVTHAPDRRAIVFAAGVDAAESLAQALRHRGIKAEAVTGGDSLETRNEAYQRYRIGDTQMLVTVQVLTEGADFPMCDAVVIARPTRSQNLYAQMVGRALRLHENKSDALVLDLVGTSRVMSLVTLTDLDAAAPTRTVNPDGTIEELVDPLDAEESVPGERQRRMGPLDVVSIDLLSTDTMHRNILWLETLGGKPFLPCDAHIVFLWPGTTAETEGLWRAGWMTAKGPKQGDWVQDGWTDLDTAASVAEDWTADAFKLPTRQQSWRRDQEPSDAQLNFAKMLGIHEGHLMTKARLSDEISVVLASRRLDHQ